VGVGAAIAGAGEDVGAVVVDVGGADGATVGVEACAAGSEVVGVGRPICGGGGSVGAVVIGVGGAGAVAVGVVAGAAVVVFVGVGATFCDAGDDVGAVVGVRAMIVAVCCTSEAISFVKSQMSAPAIVAMTKSAIVRSSRRSRNPDRAAFFLALLLRRTGAVVV
jgi:hypothetical protein